jgi:tape measure domain-containing protein
MAKNAAEYVLKLIDRIAGPARRMRTALQSTRKANDALKASSTQAQQSINRLGLSTMRAGDLAGRGAAGMRKFAMAASAASLAAKRAQNMTDKQGRIRDVSGRFTGASGFMRRKGLTLKAPAAGAGERRVPGMPLGQAPPSTFLGGAKNFLKTEPLMQWNAAAGKALDKWRELGSAFMETPLGMVAGGLAGIAMGALSIAKDAALAAVKVTLLIGGLAALAAITLAKNVVEMRIFSENSRRGLAALTGSVQAGNAAFEQGRRIANELNISAKDSVQSLIALRAAQFSLGEAEGLIKLTHDLQGVTHEADQADRILHAITKIKSTGRLQGDELMMLAEAGLSLDMVYGELQKTLGKTRAQILKMQTAGKITAEQAIAAIRTAIMHKLHEEGPGDFAKSWARETVGGIVQQLRVLPENLMLDISELIDVTAFKEALGSIIDALKGINRASVADFVTSMLRDFRKLTDIAIAFGQGFGEAWEDIRLAMGVDVDTTNIKDLAKSFGKLFGEFLVEGIKAAKAIVMVVDSLAPFFKAIEKVDAVDLFNRSIALMATPLMPLATAFSDVITLIREFMGLRDKLAGKPPPLPNTWGEGKPIFPFATPQDAVNASLKRGQRTGALGNALGSSFPDTRGNPLDQSFYAPPQQSGAPQLRFAPEARGPTSVSTGSITIHVTEPNATPADIGKAVQKAVVAALAGLGGGQFGEEA